jgi:hypothetical protein
MIGEIALPPPGSHGIAPMVAGISDEGFFALVGFLHAERKAASLE